MRHFAAVLLALSVSVPAVAQFGPPRTRVPQATTPPPVIAEDDGVPTDDAEVDRTQASNFPTRAPSVAEAEQDLPSPKRWDEQERDWNAERERREPAVREGEVGRELGRVADAAEDPRTQAAVSEAIGAMADAVANIRIDRIRDAVRRFPGAEDERDGRYRDRGYDDDRDGRGRDRTLGDVLERDDPNFRERIRERAADAARTAGGAARAAERMEPELRRVADDFARAIEDALARAGGGF